MLQQAADPSRESFSHRSQSRFHVSYIGEMVAAPDAASCMVRNSSAVPKIGNLVCKHSCKEGVVLVLSSFDASESLFQVLQNIVDKG